MLNPFERIHNLLFNNFLFSNPQIQGICSKIFYTSLVLYSITKLSRWFMAKVKGHDLKRLGKSLKIRRNKKIQNAKKLLENFNITQEKKDKILKATVTELLELLNKLEVTSQEILLTYYERASTIGLQTQNIADVFIEEAYEQAKKFDQIRQKYIKEKKDLTELGPLFGIPISLKDAMFKKDTYTTGGLCRNCRHPDPETGLVVELMEKAGAIPFIKTNIPQALWINESKSIMWGRAKNPWDLTRTVGGSSGGEGGLIALRGSPLGIGNDQAGSVRIPCLYCGIYGLMPTTKRITYIGGHMPFDKIGGQINTNPVMGPMGKCTDDLALVMKSFLTTHMFDNDPAIPRLYFNEEVYNSKKKLKVGYILNNDYFAVSKPNQRAILESVEALKKLGHEVVQIEYENFEEYVMTNIQICGAMGDFREVHDALQGEPLIKEYSLMNFSLRLPKCITKIAGFFMQLIGQKRIGQITKVSGKKSAYEFLQISSKQQELKKQMFNIYKKHNLDAIISPGLALPCLKHGQAKFLFLNCAYTFIWNLMDFPTGAMPITKVREDEQVYEDHYNDQFVKEAKKTMQNSKGLPVGIQITTLPYEEELCLNIMKQIESVINFHEFPQI